MTSDESEPVDERFPFPLPRKHGPWIIEGSKMVYQDPWIGLRRDEVKRPDGSHGTYSIALVKQGVCVVAVDHRGHVHLTSEFHYAVGRVTLEGVSGGIETGFSPEEMAHRELEEELGIRAGRLVAKGVTDPFTAGVVSPTRLFAAYDLTFGEAKPEGTELITPVSMPLQDAIAAVLDGTITHAPTCIILLRLGLEGMHRTAN